MVYHHVPVLLSEAVEGLRCVPGNKYADCTLGGAGHAKAILEKIIPGGLLIGIDKDQAAVSNAEALLAPYLDHVRLFRGNFTGLKAFSNLAGIDCVDGILADLGLSFYQIDQSGRGFGFGRNEPLDMRMDSSRGDPAEVIVNTSSEGELERIFKEYGEERWAGRIARNLVSERARRPVQTSEQLTNIVLKSIPGHKRRKDRIHPATRVFMALRIAVNTELENLERLIDESAELLNPGGRLCIIAFHSLEDRIVKTRMRAMEGRCTCSKEAPICICDKTPVFRVITKKPIRPGQAEIAENPMSGSARLRIAEKI